MEEDLYNELKENGERERELATKAGKAAEDGIAEVDVEGDGSWGMRAYNHNYASPSGCVSLRYESHQFTCNYLS
jgi:hypothetical protein